METIIFALLLILKMIIGLLPMAICAMLCLALYFASLNPWVKYTFTIDGWRYDLRGLMNLAARMLTFGIAYLFGVITKAIFLFIFA